MQKYLGRMVLILVSHLLSAVAQAGDATKPIRMETLELGKLASGRTGTIQAWFPEGKCDDRAEKQLCLADGAGPARPKGFDSSSASQKDERVRMIVMLDPALGSAAQAQSLLKIEVPTLVIGATNNDFLPWTQHGLRYATEIPNAETHLLTAQEGHFVFLDPCHHQTKVMGIALCDDRDGVDRKATHDIVANTIVEFVRAHDAVFAAQKTASVPARQYSASSTVVDILMYTPRWVFGLLVGLVTIGLLQTRTRQVRIPVALVLPIGMLLLSLTGMLRYVGWRWTALSCWLMGLAAVASLSVAWMDKSIGRFDSSSRKLQIRGSWWPLVVILGIFFTRYALGVATAMQLSVIRHAYFQEAISGVLGGWSGFFLARGIVFWRASVREPSPQTN